MVSFINEHWDDYEVESICSQLPIAPPTIYDHRAKQQSPESRSERARRDDALCADIQRVYVEDI